MEVIGPVNAVAPVIVFAYENVNGNASLIVHVNGNATLIVDVDVSVIMT